MEKEPNPAEVAAAEKEAAEKKAKEDAAKKGLDQPIPTVDLNPKPTAAEDMISKANAAAARQEAANVELKTQVDRMEALKVEQTLGGKTDAGGEPIVDENAGAKKLLEGTGYEDQIFPKDDPKK